MLDSETLEKLQKASVEDRIVIIEMILHSLKNEISSNTPQPQRPAFGFMKDTGKILGDIVAPVLPETEWNVLQ